MNFSDFAKLREEEDEFNQNESMHVWGEGGGCPWDAGMGAEFRALAAGDMDAEALERGEAQ